MRTNSVLTTISYNSIGYLEQCLSTLLKEQQIDFYAFMFHNGEIDDFDGSRDKDHIHLLVRPLKTVDTVALLKSFEEFDKDNPTTPLGVVHFEKCKCCGSWVYYSMHYAPYLDSINETKEFLNYPFDSFHTNNEQELKRLRRSYKIEYKPKYNTIETLLKQGISIANVKRLINPNTAQIGGLNNMIADILDKSFTEEQKPILQELCRDDATNCI